MKTGPRAVLGRLGGFGASLIFSTLINLLAIPFVIVNLGADVWGRLAVVMATSAVIGIGVAFGWGTVGAAMTAATPMHRRPKMYVNSFVSRAYLYLFALIPSIAITLLITNLDPISGAIACSAYLLPHLGASWYFVGESKPWRLLMFDVLPQGLGTILGTASTYLSHEVWTYVAFQLVFNLVAVLGSVLFIRRLIPESEPPPETSIRSALARLRDQWHGVVAAGTGTINSNGPIIAVTLLAPASLPVYALADKLLRYAIAGFGPILQLTQGWIPAGDRAQQNHRVRRAAYFSPVLGALGGLALAAIMPFAAAVLSAGNLGVDLSLAVPFGLVYFSVIVAQIVGLACLIPLGQGVQLARSTAVGAAITVILIVVLGQIAGAVGVIWAAAVGELTVATYQLGVVWRHFHRMPRQEQGAADQLTEGS